MEFKCELCGTGWEGDDTKCPRCGLDAGKAKTPPSGDPLPPTKPVPPPGQGRRYFWLALSGLALLLLVLVGVFFLWFGSRDVGAGCEEDADCNSHKCLFMFGTDVLASSTGGICTELCEKDTDCPEEMVCGRAVRGRTRNSWGEDNRRRVCFPTGERLRELITR